MEPLNKNGNGIGENYRTKIDDLLDYVRETKEANHNAVSDTVLQGNGGTNNGNKATTYGISGNGNGNGHLLESLTVGKLYFIKGKIALIERHIADRNKIRDKGIERINDEIMKFDTLVFEHKSKWGWHFDLKADDAEKVLMVKLADFERQKNDEDFACWRDTAGLKSLVLDLQRDYDLTKMKVNLMKNGN
jgi:hypothetical protein